MGGGVWREVDIVHGPLSCGYLFEVTVAGCAGLWMFRPLNRPDQAVCFSICCWHFDDENKAPLPGSVCKRSEGQGVMYVLPTRGSLSVICCRISDLHTYLYSCNMYVSLYSCVKFEEEIYV